jgi:cholesterol oxidase
MGIDREQGVIDEYGEVHGYQGLYVVDGAAVPSATGVNPSASILAMAERNVERAIRRILGDELWEAPEMAEGHAGRRTGGSGDAVDVDSTPGTVGQRRPVP